MNPTFGLYDPASEDARCLASLIQEPCIWEGMRVDGRNKIALATQDWPGCFVSIMRGEDLRPVGFQIFLPRLPQAYEMHVGFLENARGEIALQAVSAIAKRMFIETDALQVIIQCPDWNQATRIFAARFGATQLFRKENFALRDGKVCGASYYHRRLSDWMFGQLSEFEREDIPGDGDLIKGVRAITIEVAKFNPAKADGFYNWFALVANVPGVKVEPILDGCVLTFPDLRIVISRGKIALIEEIQCH